MMATGFDLELVRKIEYPDTLVANLASKAGILTIYRASVSRWVATVRRCGYSHAVRDIATVGVIFASYARQAARIEWLPKTVPIAHFHCFLVCRAPVGGRGSAPAPTRSGKGGDSEGNNGNKMLYFR